MYFLGIGVCIYICIQARSCGVTLEFFDMEATIAALANTYIEADPHKLSQVGLML